MGTYNCKNCTEPFEAREADRRRGWARFCSKSCKAKHQEKRTGQYRRFKNTEFISESSEVEFHPFSEEAVQGGL